MQSIVVPGERLRSAEKYVTRGGKAVDVGTDHAYLPIWLIKQGLISSALAADINSGPLQSARTNIEAAGMQDLIETLLTDGLHGVREYAPDDIMVFGMGGELIAKILSEAPWVRNERIGLILQPMSRASVLRAWLLENGFAITGETLTFEDRYYQTIAARWCGKSERYSESELLLGRLNIEERSPHFVGFVKHEIEVLSRVIDGKKLGQNADVSAELRIKNALEALL